MGSKQFFAAVLHLADGETHQGVFPLIFNLRLIRAVAFDQHEEWMEGSRYLNADLLREKIKPMKTQMTTS